MSATFSHLHVHSHFSLLAALPAPEALAKRAAADGMIHLALTDANALYGAVTFSHACQTANVAPILGMSLTLAGDQAGDAPETVVLLAHSAAGWRSLYRLSALIQAVPTRDQRARMGISRDELAEHAAGLICLPGGRQSTIERALRTEDLGAARASLQWFAAHFGDHCHLSLEIHNRQDSLLALRLAALARETGVGVVAVQPIYTIEKDQRRLIHVLTAIAQNQRLDTVNSEAWPGGDPDVDLHWLSRPEMDKRFAQIPGAVAASATLAATCEPFLPSSTPIWPVLPLPHGQTPDEALAAGVRTGAQTRFVDTQPLAERITRELQAITGRGFAPLFLIVADIVAYARRAGVPVSTRGSVANSLVAFCLGITTVDPIANDLLFERFLNPAREGLPDIDLDFCSRRRDLVLEYVRRTYGEDRVALVATVSTLRPRSAVRETAKAHGLDEDAIERLARLLPDSWHPDPRRRVKSDPDAVLRSLANPVERQAVSDAYALVGQPDHLSVHPGGVVITPGPLTDYVPVQWAPKGFLTTQYDHGDVEAIGLPKLDLLGIRALTVLADAAELVRAYSDPAFSLDAISLDDGPTGELLMRAETVGVFQCESTGAQRTLRQLKAHSVRDLAVANAFFKPGPATGGMAANFVRRYRGEEAVHYLHPALAPILGSTRGVLLFQEQILRVAREVAGLSWAEADQLRRGMSKFQSDAMAQMRDRFVAGCQRPVPAGPGLNRTQAQTLWQQVAAFAGYGFNQGHATAYADVSYRSAYVKTHWPAAFLAARMADWGGFHHQAIYIAEARRLGIAVRPPHVNHSLGHFTLEFEEGAGIVSPVLWMGLGQVRDLRKHTTETIVVERSHRPFSDLADLMQRVPLQQREINNLIQCGALDGLGANRATLLEAARELERAGSGQMTFGFLAVAERTETTVERLAWEEHVLGFPVSVHPLQSAALPPGTTTLTAAARTPGQPVKVPAVKLPGWTGGPGFFIGDERTYAVAVTAGDQRPKTWRPALFHGRWVIDGWGGATLQCDRFELLSDV